MRVLEGQPHRLGATWDGRGTNFALFSANAEKVELCLFDRQGRRELERIALPERTDDIWHGYFPEIARGQVYGYRVHGPYDPAQGHRFNPNKLLLDPYAKRLIGPFVWSDAHFGYRTKSARLDLSFDRRDNARGMLKAMVVDPAFAWGNDRRPEHAWHETIIYEAHVKGLTMRRGDVPHDARGFFRGLTSNATIAHLRKLGVTAIELLPLHAFLDDRYLVDKGLKNYWGYNSIGFFAPEARYAAGDDALGEFQSVVSQLHQGGIEVILDVVYNHTAEGSELGPTLSFRGIDNASYYWLKPDEPRYYENFTGTGNALNLTHPRVLQMVMDSLRYWVEQCHVDGFRFDLATTLGRGPNGFDPHVGFFAAVAQDPVLSRVKMIAEPWDIGLGGYQLGAFPQGWSEWNDKFRRAMRSYWRGEPNLIGEVASRLTGSADVFRHQGRGPRSSINHVTVHDGFTLADVTMYEHKHNEANGEDNRDGSDDNQSVNWGVEGPSDDPNIVDLRQRARRNLLASLLLSHGIPLLLAGDEVGNSQSGNNNAYCQDNEVGWIDWSRLGVDGDDNTAFVSHLTAMRRRYAQLQPQHWLNGKDGNHPPDILWLTPHGGEMSPEDWAFPEARFLTYVMAAIGEGGAPLFIVLNSGGEAVEFVFPEFLEHESWAQVLTTVPGPHDGDQTFHVGAKHNAERHSIMVFEGRT
jgi:glycogen operon protein